MSAARLLRIRLGVLALGALIGAGQAASPQTGSDRTSAQVGTTTAAAEAPAPAAAVAVPAAAPAASPTAPAAGQAPSDPALAAAIEAGHTEYLKNCRACHGSKGTAGVPLAGNYKVEGGYGYLGWAIITGPGYMPEFGPALTDEQIALICTYILNNWGNSYGIVTPEDIASIR